MPKLTKTQAARQLGIARATLYKLISQGKVSPTPDGLIDQAELVRVAPYIDTLHERSRTPTDVHERLQTSTDTMPIDTQNTRDALTRHLPVDVHEQSIVDVSGRLQTSTDTLVDILREQLRLMQEREREHARLYEERERAYREHIAQLTTMLDQAHQQNQRLLDMPRRAPLSPQSPQDAPGATQPPPPPQIPPRAPTPAGDPRGAMRQRILTLLREYPDGLSTAEMRNLLGVDRSLADTCLGMRKYGLIQRIGRGTYIAVTEQEGG